MRTVVYSCPFVPAEWIAAHGLTPRRIVPDGDQPPSPGAPAGVCPYAWAFTHAASSDALADAVVFTTACDQMRRASEWVARDSDLPVFLMNVPSTCDTPTARQIYVSEVERLGNFLVRLGGSSPSSDRLADVMAAFDQDRAALRSARPRMTARRYSEAIAAFHRERSLKWDDLAGSVHPSGVRVAFVGGPLLSAHLRLFDLVERSGGVVVLDATTTGERTMPAPFDRAALRTDPFTALVDAYFGSIPDAFRRPNRLLYQWLQRETSLRAVQGIIFHYYTWCDTWHAEAERLKESSHVPVLPVAGHADREIAPHTVSRIEAFIEMLR